MENALMGIGAWQQELLDPGGLRENGRKKGLGKTMIIDKGLGLSAFRDLLEVSGRHIDMVKLAFGTAVLYEPDVVRQKLNLAAKQGIIVMPGGTLLETAIVQGAAEPLMDKLCAIGFTGIEVSDGTIFLDRLRRTSLIKQGVQRGLFVVTEYGKKIAGSSIDADELAFTAECDLRAGAQLVAVEARESGTNIGLYDEQGHCRQDLLETIKGAIGEMEPLLWEAPLKHQQAELLSAFGAGVHLGNVAPGDALALEAMRRGLRADTFRLARGSAVYENGCEYMI
ncbi:phosphosulfolactate synthase [Paenibacillus chungangensis]|uniref:Phosphosulfolactate synthase n=1 Tax=Paenibacillus chungangensis TaxID=696535 RepID=A0ABW3HMJ5_9BACL